MKFSGYQQLLGYQNIFFCIQQKKEIHTGLEQPDMFIFGWTILLQYIK